DALPALDRRTDLSLEGSRGTARFARALLGSARGWVRTVRLRALEESARRRRGSRRRRPRICLSRGGDPPDGLVRVGRLSVPNLFRFLRILRHGDRPRKNGRFPLQTKFRLALSIGVDNRILEAMAHLALHVATRLSVSSARRQPPRRD